MRTFWNRELSAKAEIRPQNGKFRAAAVMTLPRPPGRWKGIANRCKRQIRRLLRRGKGAGAPAGRSAPPFSVSYRDPADFRWADFVWLLGALLALPVLQLMDRWKGGGR